jgi:hypothetical protein
MARNHFITADVAAEVNPADVRIQPTTKQNSVRYSPIGHCPSSTP